MSTGLMALLQLITHLSFLKGNICRPNLKFTYEISERNITEQKFHGQTDIIIVRIVIYTLYFTENYHGKI